jgi:hypothetical protein
MSLTSLLTPETMRAHKASWYVYVDGRRMPRVATMRGRWDYDVVCSCGWDSGTGGGLKRYVEDKLWNHRWDAQENLHT